jgi:hypothetical protein
MEDIDTPTNRAARAAVVHHGPHLHHFSVRYRAGTVVGIMDSCPNGVAAWGEIVTGRIVDVTETTASVFRVTAALCAAGAICMLFVRRSSSSTRN